MVERNSGRTAGHVRFIQSSAAGFGKLVRKMLYLEAWWEAVPQVSYEMICPPSDNLWTFCTAIADEESNWWSPPEWIIYSANNARTSDIIEETELDANKRSVEAQSSWLKSHPENLRKGHAIANVVSEWDSLRWRGGPLSADPKPLLVVECFLINWCLVILFLCL